MPNRESFLPFAQPDIGESEIGEVMETLRSGWLTTGPKAREFERRFAQYVGARHAVAVSSGTAALHLALLSLLDLKPGDEVIIPTYTFAATGEVIVYTGATPVLVDSVRGGFNLDPEAVLQAVTPRTRAVIVVHIGGEPADMDPIITTAQRHSLKVIEDAAHAPPTLYKGRPAGRLGDAAAFSFYATKSICCGEGGMFVTEDDSAERSARVLALHGMSRDAWKRYAKDGGWRYDIERAGYKYNLSDLHAALGLAQLARVDEIYRKRLSIAQRYDAAFGAMEELILPPRDSANQNAWHLYPLRLNPLRAKVSRDLFIERMRERNIGTSVHFIPLHLHSYWRDRFGFNDRSFPNAFDSFSQCVSLPIYSKMSNGDVDDVINAVKAALSSRS